MRSERGQASLEWIGLTLLCSLVLGAVATFVPAFGGRSFGAFVTHEIVCTVKGGCDDGDAELAAAYGERDAELVRRHAPGLVYEPGEKQLPVDWRECRESTCAQAPDDRDLDAHRTHGGLRATVFTRVVRRGGKAYIEYWFYYPDSNSAIAGSDKIWERSHLAQLVTGLVTGKRRYPGYHLDDWEGYEVEVDRRGRARVRTTTHGGWQYCKKGCEDEWGPDRGWTRVSRGSHSGHVPDRLERERTTGGSGVRLIPLERAPRARYRALDPGVKPPWLKRAWSDPLTPDS